MEKTTSRKKIFEITSDTKFYGIVYTNFAIFELGQFPTYNAWRPVVKLEWKKANKNTNIVSSYSLNKSVYLFLSVLPIFGLNISFKQNIIIPFVFTIIVYLILIYGVFLLIYIFSRPSKT